MTPVEIARAYREKGWPGPDDEKKLYRMLLSGTYYMFQQGRLARHDGKYSLPNKTISPGVNAPGENKT